MINILHKPRMVLLDSFSVSLQMHTNNERHTHDFTSNSRCLLGNVDDTVAAPHRSGLP